jgi:hypothetical protein
LLPPGYGTPYGPQPPRPGGSKTPLIAAIIVLLLIAGGVTTYLLTKSDKKKTVAQSSTSPSDISESDARAVVSQYLKDVNAQDRTDAATLICPELVDAWRSSIDKASGDFTVSVTNSTFQGSTPTSDGLDLKYSLDVKSTKTSQTGTSPVTFTIVDRSGDLLICGEK